MTRHRSAAIVPLLLLSLLTASCNAVTGPTASVPPAKTGVPPAKTSVPPATETPSETVAVTLSPSAVIRRSTSPAISSAVLELTLLSGPYCPVEVVPPDPDCAPRPVADATVVIRDAAGREIARVTTDVTGHARIMVSGGAYTIEAQPVAGLMGTPGPERVTVAATGTTEVSVIYDTGIR